MENQKKVRVFLASSNELVQEREYFETLIKEMKADDRVTRNYDIDYFLWEVQGIGAGKDNINEAIQDSADFENLDLVIVLFWNRLGEGTIGEYRKAVDQFKKSGKPQVYVYFKEPAQETAPEEVEKINQFIKQMIDVDSVIPNRFKSTEQFGERFKERFLKFLEQSPRVEQSTVKSLKNRFQFFGWLTFFLSLCLVALASSMSFPRRLVNSGTTLAVLALPVLIFLADVFMLFYFHMFLNQFKKIWRSLEWSNDSILFLYRYILPAYAAPAQVKERFKVKMPVFIGMMLIVIVLFFAPVYAQYYGLFEEITGWKVTFCPQEQDEKTGENKYWEEGRRTWFFGFQSEETAKKYEQEKRPVVYVYAPGEFKAKEPFRRNLGQEVFIPIQAWIYLLLLVMSFGGGLFSFFRLSRLRKELEQ